MPEDQAAEGEKQVQEKESLAAMEDELREAAEEQLTVSEAKTEGQQAEAGPSPRPRTRHAEGASLREEQAAAGSLKTDSLKDLDIVAVSEAQCSEPVYRRV